MQQSLSLYQIGIRCLAATRRLQSGNLEILYQIGIRCLAATRQGQLRQNVALYQIGIRCLAATAVCHILDILNYIKLELDV